MLRKIFLTLALAAAGLSPALLSAAPGDLSVLSSPTSQPIILGEKHRFHSGLLNEEREYWLRIPPSYAQNKLPLEVTVFYVMDAENISRPLQLQPPGSKILASPGSVPASWWGW